MGNSSSAVSSGRAYAIIPAAGESRRMGEDKLLLPWGEGRLIDALIDRWQRAAVDAVVAVVHPQNQPLINHCREHHFRGRRVELVIPESPPPEMKDSVRLALAHIEEKFEPADEDIWLLAPADMPAISPAAIRKVMDHARRSNDTIVVASHDGKKGHPAALRWKLVKEVAALGSDEGVNAIFARHGVKLLECGPEAIVADVDTPEDYQRLRDELES